VSSLLAPGAWISFRQISDISTNVLKYGRMKIYKAPRMSKAQMRLVNADHQKDAELLPDEELRPWTFDDAMDKKIKDERLSLDVSMRRNAPLKMGGDYGPSELDHKVPQLIELDHIIEHPELYPDSDDDVGDGADSAEPPYEDQAVDVEEEKLPEYLADDSRLWQAVNELNAVSQRRSVIQELRDRKRAKELERLLRKDPKNSLESVKYVPRRNPAVMNMSSNEFTMRLQEVLCIV
jgi:hypothetical protein